MFIEWIRGIYKNTNIRRLILPLILVILLALFYFSFLSVITPDSTDYYNLSNILKGVLPFSQWWQLRGPTLPAVIYLITLIFGDNPTGFLVGTFVFYLLMISFIFLITKQVTKLFDSRAVKVLVYAVVVLLIVFNPLIIGYYHAMLTEFVATTVAVICCFMAYKWIDISYTEKIKYLVFTIGFSLLISAMWLLKQPYVTVAALPFLVASIISIIRIRNRTNIISKVVALIFCLFFTILMSMLWSNFLCQKISCSENSDTQGYFSRGLINGVSDLKEVSGAKKEDIINGKSPESEYLNSSDKKLILDISENKSNYKSYRLYEVDGSNGTIIDLMVAGSSNSDGSLNTEDSLAFLAEVLTDHPYISMESYVKNYLATIDIFAYKIEDNIYHPVAANFFRNGGENVTLSYAAFINRPIYWWPTGERPASATLLSNYEVINKPNDVALSVYRISRVPGLLLFSITFFLIPLALLYSLYVFFRNTFSKKSKRINKLNELLIILFGFSFIHVVFHAVTGAIIDRYASVAYPVALLGFILLIGSFIKRKRTCEPVAKKNSGKLLFVIPAYNEAMNIGPVIKDIKKNIPEADILVINDCSKDDTKKIVEDMNVKCITMPFNVRYAMAVQTGINYAFDNNYGYVIQFDADGQHLATEAKKLFAEAKKTNSDIVIGSRFIKKTSYKHSWPRMIGTKFFSSVIYLFCGQRIADPTSGLQCISGRVIEKYSRSGEYPEYPDANLIVDMLLKDYKIREVSVEMKQRTIGESMHGGIIKPVKYMFKITYAIFVIIMRNLEFRWKDK